MKVVPCLAAVAGFLVALTLALVGVVVLSEAASASPQIAQNEPEGDLRVDLGDSVLFHENMEPGDSRYWTLTTILDHAASADLSLRIDSDGDLAATEDGLQLAVERCASAWVLDGASPSCAGGASTVIPLTALSLIDPHAVLRLGSIARGPGPYFLAVVALPDLAPQELQAADAMVGFGFTAGADAATVLVPTGPGGPLLARTGIDPGATLLLGGLLVGAGSVLAALVLVRMRAVRR